MMNVVEYDEVCTACKGTGIYIGMAERDGAGIVCHDCKGTGCCHVKIEYESFKRRAMCPAKIERVFEVNPGIVIGKGKNGEYDLSDFGGMDFLSWLEGGGFPPKSENRKFICPAWWYQSADNSKKPDWDECLTTLGRTFNNCDHFNNKNQCWKRWDKENNNE